MKIFLRTVTSIIAGFATAMLLLIAVEAFSAVVHPVPEGFGNTPDEMCIHVANYPQWVLAIVVPLWGVTAFMTVWVAGKLGNLTSSVLVGTLFMAAVVCNLTMLPYPWWFCIASPLVAFIAMTIAVRLNVRRSPTADAASASDDEYLPGS